MANIIPLKESSGAQFYPQTHEKAVIDSNGVTLASKLANISAPSYVVAWDGNSTPVVANIPAGVTFTYDGNTYTGTLAASSSTVNKTYLVGDNNGNFDEYITQVSGSTYSWLYLGNTSIDLSDYATKAELNQLDQKIGLIDLGTWELGSTGTAGSGTSAVPSSSSTTRLRMRQQLYIPKTGTYRLHIKSGYATYIRVAQGQLAQKYTEDSEIALTAGYCLRATVWNEALAPDYSNYTAAEIAQEVLASELSLAFNDERFVESDEEVSIVSARVDRLNKEMYGNGGYVENTAIVIATGATASFDGWNSILDYLPVKPGYLVRWNIGGNTRSTLYGLAFYDKNFQRISGYTATNRVSGQNYRDLWAPLDAAYVRMMYYPTLINGNANTIPCIINGVEITAVPYIGGIERDFRNNFAADDGLHGIIGQYYPEEMPAIDKMLSAKYTGRLHFLHISDNHGTSFGHSEQFVDLCPAEFLANTGDLVTDKYTDGFTTSLNYAKTPTKPVFLIPGNHDYYKAPSAADVYNSITAEMNQHNGMELLTTYFSKDYSGLYDGNTVKCIFLDQNDGWTASELAEQTASSLAADSKMSDTQIRWFAAQLEDAASNGKHVAVFIHNAVGYMDYQRTIPTFIDEGRTVTAPITSMPFLAEMVKAFMTGGSVSFDFNGNSYSFTFSTAGHFVAWFCGHTHLDRVGWLRDYPDQFSVGICRPFRDSQPGGGSYDGDRLGVHFNYVTIDPYKRSLAVYRVGQQRTIWATHRESFVIFYK